LWKSFQDFLGNPSDAAGVQKDLEKAAKAAYGG